MSKPRISSPPHTSAEKRGQDEENQELLATDDEKLLLRRSMERAKMQRNLVRGNVSVLYFSIQFEIIISKCNPYILLHFPPFN